jgi:hypothetical protein
MHPRQDNVRFFGKSGENMKSKTESFFKKIFPNDDLIVRLGIAFTATSTPSFLFLIIGTDQLFPNFKTLYLASIIISGFILALGLSLIFWSIRISTVPGSLAYRITHPRLRR